MASVEGPASGRPPRSWRELRSHLDRSVEATCRRLGFPEPPPARPATTATRAAGAVRKRKRKRKQKREGAKPAARRPSHPDRELLARLCDETAPHHCRAEIRRRFEAATGRPISLARVARFAIVVMGLPRIKPGEHAGGIGRAEARRGLVG